MNVPHERYIENGLWSPACVSPQLTFHLTCFRVLFFSWLISKNRSALLTTLSCRAQ